MDRKTSFSEAIFGAYPDIVFIADEKGTIHEIIAGRHSESLLYDDPDVLCGNTVYDIFPQKRSERFQSVIETAIETGRPQIYEYQLTVQAGKKWFEARVEPLSQSVEGNDAVVWVSRDITQRKQYEKQLEQTTEQLEILNRVVRHDIRNDMSIILGWAEILEDYVDDEGREILQKILDSGNHIEELTAIARDYVELLTSDETIDIRPVDLKSVLQTEIDLRRESFPDADFEIDGEIPDVTVQANELLGSLFRNLLNNAVQHNDGDSPTVVISCTTNDEDVVVSIADDGPGIPDEQKKSVFGKGNRGLETSGTEIGLYLVETLVNQYGGSVWIQDNEPDGAVFNIRLRRADESVN